MDFDKLTREDLLNLLEAISPKTVARISKELVYEAVKRRIDTLHSLVCRKSHSGEDPQCPYFREEDDFKAPIHVKWTALASEVCKQHQISDEQFDFTLYYAFRVQQVLEEAHKVVCSQAPTVVIDLLSKAYCNQNDWGTSA